MLAIALGVQKAVMLCDAVANLVFFPTGGLSEAGPRHFLRNASKCFSISPFF